MDSCRDRFDEFLRAFWQDFDDGALQPLQEYVQRFPELAAEVRAEYDDATARPMDRVAGDPAAGHGARRRLIVGRYCVRRRLARGGMGLLLLADDPELGRPVVLKTVRGRRSVSAADIDRLRQEARLTGRLDHESICPVLDVISDRGRLFLVMPYVEGDDLSVWLERARTAAPVAGDDCPLSAWARTGDLRPVLRLVELAARAVHVAHEGGVIHRDLKLANIKVRPDGTPVVLDFGLAFDISLDRRQRLTAEGAVLGSPHSMAPEQIEGRLDRIDRRTDVYALGVILYELLTLKPPFEGETRNQLLQRVLRGEPTPPDRVRPAVPRDVAAVCLKAMALERHERYSTALELAADLESVRTLRSPVARPSKSQWLWRRVRRNPVASAATIAVVLLAVASVSLWWGSRNWEARAAAAIAALRIIVVVQSGGDPDTSDLNTLRREFDDEQAFTIMLQQLRSKDVEATVTRLLEGLSGRLRGSEDPSTVFLEYPRAVVADVRPVFRFRRAAGQLARRVALSVESFGQPPSQWEIDAGDRRTVAVELPAGLRLEAGREYRWSVVFPELAAEPSHQGLFSVVAPAVLAEIRLRHARTEDRAWAMLATAAELLAAGLAEDAIAELTTAPPRDPSALARVRTTLLAEACAQLGDAERLRALTR